MDEDRKIAEKMLKFIQRSPSPFHAVEEIKKELLNAGYEKLKEEKRWELIKGGRYFVTRNNSSIIAFIIPEEEFEGFRMAAGHSDSPAFKVKENPDMKAAGSTLKLNVERYGGMICSSWLDRPLSVAGRIIVRAESGFEEKLVHIDRDIALIPNVAIHMNRDANEGYKFNAQKDMLPLMGQDNGNTMLKTIAKEVGVKTEEILGHDLFLYNRSPYSIWGLNQEFVSSPRLDDLQCVYAALAGFLTAKAHHSVPVYCVFDNEEVGSSTRQGAASTFLEDTLLRLEKNLGRDYENYVIDLAKSFMISADNAHAVHPNHPEYADPVNQPELNKGIVIKYNAAQKYCSDAVSASIFKDICDQVNVPYQAYTNRSDLAGGSTLGNILNTKVALRTIDIGLPQLAMHSAYETAGVEDTGYLVKVMKAFYQ